MLFSPASQMSIWLAVGVGSACSFIRFASGVLPSNVPPHTCSLYACTRRTETEQVEDAKATAEAQKKADEEAEAKVRSLTSSCSP